MIKMLPVLIIFSMHQHSLAQNVGIGTLTPGAKLHVVNGGPDTVTAEFKNTGFTNTAHTVNIVSNGYGVGLDIKLSNQSTGASGLHVFHAGVGPGVISQSIGGNGLWGITSSISAAGIVGDNTYGDAIVGRSQGGEGFGGVVGRNDSSGYGVRGFSTKNGIGILGQAGFLGGKGIAGKFENTSASNNSDVLYAENEPGAGGNAIFGLQQATANAGVRGQSTGVNGTGIVAEANNGIFAYGIWGKSTSGKAGHFSGDVSVVGMLSKSAGTFKIDHPMDPANKYLIHSFVESPDMMNIYNGNVITDASGVAIVQLPRYFEAENIDFKYQLTILDENQFAMARVSKKIANNQFTIRTDKPGIEVSWVVTGIRNDAYAKAHRIVDEAEKTGPEKGRYLNPVENGQSPELGMDFIKEVIIQNKH